MNEFTINCLTLLNEFDKNIGPNIPYIVGGNIPYAITTNKNVITPVLDVYLEKKDLPKCIELLQHGITDSRLIEIISENEFHYVNKESIFFDCYNPTDYKCVGIMLRVKNIASHQLDIKFLNSTNKTNYHGFDIQLPTALSSYCEILYKGDPEKNRPIYSFERYIMSTKIGYEEFINTNDQIPLLVNINYELFSEISDLNIKKLKFKGSLEKIYEKIKNIYQ